MSLNIAPLIIAIDGPAGAGKGTLAKRLAARFKLAHLDSGLLYRAVGAKVLRNGGKPADHEAAEVAARTLAPADLEASELRDEVVSKAASVVAAQPQVRAALLDFQREFARHPPGGAAGAVIDGRDIGTVVCPGATIKLFITATNVRTGRGRIFRNAEITADVLLASACLPTMFQAIEIDGEPYWDGGYSGNPAVYPLIYRCNTPNILVVMLQPLTRQDPPTSAQAIRSRLTEFQFNSSFLREMRSIALAKQAIDAQWLPVGRLERRFRKLNFHLIETDDLLARMNVDKALNADLGFLLKLKEEGRTRAGTWLGKHFGQVGGESSIDLVKLFG